MRNLGSTSRLWPLAALTLALLVQTVPASGPVQRFNPPVETPSFNLPLLGGGTRSLEDFRGRPLVLSIWASWCGPCRHELPEFEKARNALAGRHPDAAFLTVNLAEGGARAKGFMDRAGLDLPVLLAGASFMDDFGIMVVPTILVYNRDGKLAVSHSGWVMDTDLVTELARDLDGLGEKS